MILFFQRSFQNRFQIYKNISNSIEQTKSNSNVLTINAIRLTDKA